MQGDYYINKYYDDLWKFWGGFDYFFEKSHAVEKENIQDPSTAGASSSTTHSNRPAGESLVSRPLNAPLIDLNRPHTDEEARAYGFVDAEDWLTRSQVASMAGLDTVARLPHELPPTPPPSTLSPASAM